MNNSTLKETIHQCGLMFQKILEFAFRLLSKIVLKAYQKTKAFLVVVLLLIFSFTSEAANETFSTGSVIINMGQSPQTIANSLKPYGAIYDLIRNYQVPIKWVIAQGKAKDACDFIYNSQAFKGGTFIIPKEFISSAVQARITFWQGQGVITLTTTTPLTVNVTYTLTSAPRWTFDAANGKIAENFLKNAGINNIDFPDAYNWKSPQSLDNCDDLYAMPHADPTWATHGNLYTWNKNSRGSIWAGCHAVSALENTINPANSAEQMNFLSTRTNVFTPTPWPDNSLKLWKNHSNGSTPYIHRLFDDPVAQYLGISDAAHTNGSEQIYMPKQSTDPGGATRWRIGAKIIAYDATQSDVPSPNLNNGNVAAVIVYGRGLDSANRGFVMYEGGHDIAGSSVEQVAAQRAFLNFSFFQNIEKAPQVSTTGVVASQLLRGGTNYFPSVSVSSILTGQTYTYQWSSSCGGNFSNATVSNPTYTPPSVANNTACILSCVITDNCGRKSFTSIPITIAPPPRKPVATADVGTIFSECGLGNTSLVLNVLSNDTDADGDALTVTNIINQTSGVWTTNGTTVTFTPSFGFTGVATAKYIVCDPTLCDTANITVGVGTPDVNGCYPGFSYLVASSDTAINQTNNSVTNPTYAFNGNYDPADPTTYAVFNASTDSLVLDFGSIRSYSSSRKIEAIIASSSTTNVTATIYGRVTTSGARTLIGTISNTDVNNETTQEFNFPGSGFRYLIIYRTAGSNDLRLSSLKINNYDCVATPVIANADNIEVSEDIPITFDPRINDENPTLSNLSISIITPPVKGKISINPDSSITYINNIDVNGLDSLTYKVCTNQNNCSIAKIYFNIIADGCTAGRYKPNDYSSPVTKTFVGDALIDDTYIKEDGANNNYGTISVFHVGEALTKRRRSLISIPNGSTSNSFRGQIPPNAVITSAKLNVYQVSGDNTTISISAYQVASGNPVWDFATVTWNKKNSTVSWTNPGSDFISAPLSTLNVTRTGNGDNGKVASFDILDAVNIWQSDTTKNRGIMLGQTVSGTQVDKRIEFAALSHGTSAYWPNFQITYVLPLPCSVIPNRAPLANPDTASTPSNAAKSIPVLANDSDPDNNSLSVISIVGSVTGGTATISGTNIIFTPNSTFKGVSNFYYRVSDGTLSDTALVSVTVTNVAPNAVNDIVSTNSNTAVNINVKSNDSDTDGPVSGAPSIVTNPKNGIATISGNNIIYTPITGFTGKDTLRYQICESISPGCGALPLCSTAFVYITVNNQSPVANKDSVSTNLCQSVLIKVLANDTDPENGVLTVSIVSQPSNGTASLEGDQIRYIPNGSFSGPTDQFTYRICDNGVSSLCSSAIVKISINSQIVNQKPTANADNSNGTLNNKVYISVLDNDYDSENQALTVSLPNGVLQPLHGTATVLPNGLIEYTPNLNFLGNDSLQYVICDVPSTQVGCTAIPSKCDTAKIYISILRPDSYIINAVTENGTAPSTGGLAIANVTINDDISGSPVTLGASGNATIAQSGSWPSGITLNTTTGAVIVANGTTPGKYPVAYQLCDKLNPVSCATVVDTVTVTPVVTPITENGTVASATGGIAISNVASNDFVNGLAATLGAGGNATVAQSGSWPSGITLNTTTGAVSVSTGLTPGKYPITYQLCDKITPVTCATVIDTVIVTPSITSTTPGSRCGPGSVTLSATASSGTMNWYAVSTGGTSLGSGNNFITPSISISTTYYVDATDNGITSSRTAVIATINQIPTASVPSQTNVNCFGLSTGSATANASGGSSPYSYSWSTNPIQNTATATNLSAGTYIVTIIDNKGCTSTANVTITQPAAALSSNISSQTNVNCFGQSTGSATVNASGGTSPYTYSWNTSPIKTTATATGLSAGTYIVTVTDNNGCTSTSSVTITQPTSSLLSSISSITNVNCFGQNTGAATATASGGTSPYTYSWNTSPIQTTATATVLSAGSYTVTVTDSKGCLATSNISISQPASALTLTCNSTNVSAEGGSNGVASMIVTGGTGPYTHKWNTGATTASISGLSAGIYTDTVTDANGCKTYKECAISQPAANCNGFRTQTQGGWGQCKTNGGNPGTYLAENFAAAFPSGLTVGCTNTLKLTSALEACNFLPSGSTASALPSGILVNPQDSYSNVLAGQVVALTLNLGFDNYDANFSPATTLVKNLVVNSGTFAGWTVQQVLDEANKKLGGCASSYTFSQLNDAVTKINENYVDGNNTGSYLTCCSYLTVGIGSQTNINCFGNSTGAVSVTAAGGVTPYQYKLDNGSYQSSSSFSGLSAGSYVVYVKDVNNCIQSVNVTITQPSAPLSSSISSQTNVNCFGQSTGSATVSTSGGTSPYTYSWNTSPVQTTATATGLAAGTYTVTVTDNKGCTTTANVTITQPSAPLSSSISSQTNVNCFGQSTGSATVSTSGGTSPYTYSWNTSPVQTTATATGLAAGTYTVTVTDNKGCTTTVNVTITQPSAALNSSISSQTNVNCFGQSTGSATVSTSGGTSPYTYSWNTSPVQTTATASGLAAGTYTVTVTDNKGCITTANVTITEPSAALSANVPTQTNVNCFGQSTGSATVSTSGGTAPYTYSWNTSPVQTTATATGLAAGTYTVTVTDNKGCITTANVTITQPSAALSSNISSQTNVNCFGQSTGSATVTTSGGTSPYTYSWNTSPVQTTATASGLAAGTYTVTVTDNKGCTTTANVT
ncbi:MAG: tandem-95 repeat protein, partial [Chitinophagaceae bacterium]|nr:tandem-95 repeat protein [Chitinophagaceae bacterium]